MWKRYLLDAGKSFKVHIRLPRLVLVRQAHDPELAEGFSLGEEREIRERGF
jgi:hypothetical protein